METKEWQQFWKTGNISDYLAYREQEDNHTKSGKGEKTVKHAGICSSDRDDFAGPSHGRI